MHFQKQMLLLLARDTRAEELPKVQLETLPYVVTSDSISEPPRRFYCKEDL